MKIITVASIEEASLEAIKIIPKEKEIDIAITGGNFGNHFLRNLKSSKDDLKKWEIFITDERITKEKIQSQRQDQACGLCLYRC